MVLIFHPALILEERQEGRFRDFSAETNKIPCCFTIQGDFYEDCVVGVLSTQSQSSGEFLEFFFALHQHCLPLLFFFNSNCNHKNMSFCFLLGPRWFLEWWFLDNKTNGMHLVPAEICPSYLLLVSSTTVINRNCQFINSTTASSGGAWEGVTGVSWW